MPPSTKRVTIKDVAAHAGVSVAAASKVLRHAYGVSPEMAARVQSSIDVLGYRPLAAARGMRGRTFTIGVLVSDIQNPFFGVLVEGVAQGIAGQGYELLIGPGGASAESQSRMVDAMTDRQMDGLILISPVATEAELAAVARKTPLVVVGRHGPSTDYDTVAGDDVQGSRLIVDHLVGLGHRRIAHVTHLDLPNTDERLPQRMRARGYEEAMRAHGLGDEIDVIGASWSQEGGHRAGEELLARQVLPTAVHAGADIAAFGLLSAFWETAYSVPADLSVAGYDDTPTASLAPVALTTIDQSGEEMGRRAAQLLVERIDGRVEAVSTLIEPQLVVRRTTAPPRD